MCLQKSNHSVPVDAKRSRLLESLISGSKVQCSSACFIVVHTQLNALACTERAPLTDLLRSAEIDWDRAEDGVLIAGAGIAGLAAAAALHKVHILACRLSKTPMKHSRKQRPRSCLRNAGDC